MQIGGTLINAVIRIAVLAAALALAYYFIVRPVLDTTEKVTGGISGNIERALDDVNKAFDQSGAAGTTFNVTKIKRQIKGANGARQQRLIRCIEHAQQDVGRIKRCTKRFAY